MNTCSVFTRENTDEVPRTDNGFKSTDSVCLGELMMTPSLVIVKIPTVKEGKSSVLDGIPTFRQSNNLVFH